MNFLHSEVELQSGNAVRVTLQGTEANVLVLDDDNFRSYREGRQYSYFGGHFKQSPAIIRPPYSGRWHVVVDLGGYAGRVNAAIHVI